MSLKIAIVSAAVTLPLAVAVLAPGTAWALQSTPRIDARQDAQKARIVQGVRAGTLTPRETRALIKEQKRIRRLERQAMTDGLVTRRERLRIERAQDRASRHIYVQKRDPDTRW